MEEILSKRIILLTNALIILSGIGFIALIHRVDSSYKASEYAVLNKLRNCIESLPKDAASPAVTNEAAQDWLQAHDPATNDKRFHFSVNLAQMLSNAGYGKDISNIKSTDESLYANYNLISVISMDTVNCCAHTFGGLTGAHKLKHFIEQYDHLQSPAKIITAIGAPEDLLKKAISESKDSFNITTEEVDTTALKRSTSHALYVGGRAHLEGVSLQGDSCVISFGVISFNQEEPGLQHIAVKAETRTTGGLTLMDLYNIDPDYRNLRDSKQFKKLETNYGDIPMDKVVDMIGEDYMEAYESIDVFGFSFSTTSLPMASLAFSLFLVSGIFLMVRDAEKRKFKVLTGIDNEDITDFFVKRPFIRFVIWLVLPLASLAATLPHLAIEDEKLIVLCSGAGLLLLLSTLTLLKARKL